MYSFLLKGLFVVNKNLKERAKISVLAWLVSLFFSIEKYLLKFVMINYPTKPVIFAIWHRNQCMIYNTKDKEKFYVLISASNDGEIVSRGIKCLGLKSIRGSSKRKGVSASLEILDKLKEGSSIAMMVDGPRGPKEKVKDGIIYMAKNSGVPIVPVAWASKDKTFIKFNTWDEFRLPLGYCRTLAIYGNPIYVPQDITKDDVKVWCEKIENEIKNLETDLYEHYDEYIKQK